MKQYIARPNDTITFCLAIIDEHDPTNNPVTGQSATVAFLRMDDGKYYDFVSGLWDTVASLATLGSEHKAALTDGLNASYTKELSLLTADPNAQGTYFAFYDVANGTYKGFDVDQWDITLQASASGIVASSATNAPVLDEEEIECVQGDPIILAYTCNDSDDVVVNITGHKLYWTLKTIKNSTNATDTDALMQITATITNGALGTCSVTVSSAQTMTLTTDTVYYWDLCDITDGHITYARGTFIPRWHTTNKTS
jgi:hypothetical protein